MWCDALKGRLLAARDDRQQRLEQGLAAGFPTLVCLGLNIPGEEKLPTGARQLFGWGWRALERSGLGPIEIDLTVDSLGPFALFGSCSGPEAVKRKGVAIEAEADFARLLDLDVYDRQGRPVDRQALGLPLRRCLLCAQPAKECIRLGRHRHAELKERIDELLAPFRP